MTQFREDIITAIAKRLSLQQGHGLPVAEGYRHLAEEFVTDIRPIINTEFARLSGTAPSPKNNLRVDVDRLAARIVTAACELDGPADPASDDTISITMKDLEAVVHRHVTAAVEGDKL